MVRGSWLVVSGSWFVARGSWFVAPLIGELSAQLTERFSRQPLRPYGHLPYDGRHNPHGPSQAILARQAPTNGRRRTVARTDSRGGRPARGSPDRGSCQRKLTERFSRQPLRPYGHLPYYGRHNPHEPSQAILARQAPTNGRRRTAARTDSRGGRPARGSPDRGAVSAS